MRKTQIIIVAVIALAVCALAWSSAQPSSPQPATAPMVPLMGQLLAPNGDWLTAYADEPAGKVAEIYTIRQLMVVAQQQGREIEALKTRVDVLEAHDRGELTPEEANTVVPATGGE